MKQHVRLNLNNIIATTTLPTLLSFVQCENIKNCNITFSSFIINPTLFGAIRVDNIWYSKIDIKQISEDETYIEFDCYIDLEYEDILSLMKQNILEFDVSGYSSIFLFKQQSENDVLSKDIDLWEILSGKFNHAINLKNVNVDVMGYDRVSNYAWIPSLNRYYYIDSVELISADVSRLHLKEDVLMTWKTLIKQQSAFVSRSESVYDLKIVDNRYPLQNVKKVTYESVVATTTGSLKNVTFKGSFGTTECNVMVSTIYPNVAPASISSPANGLPALSPNISDRTHNYFLTYSQLSSFLIAIKERDDLASYVNSVIILPFVPNDAYNVPSATDWLQIETPNVDYILCTDKEFHDVDESPLPTPISVKHTLLGVSPYLILEDFVVPEITSWKYNDPYTMYELFIPFVGWVKVDIMQLSNSRMLLYYTIDYITGNGSAYLYNVTTGKVIYSCSCQLGIKVDLITSNALELERSRQATELNTLIGLLASGLSITAGVVSENPVAVAGGVLSAGKTIASAVNSERMRFERAQVTYGNGNAGYHSNLSVSIRITTYQSLITSTSEEDIYKHLQGYPCNKYMALSSISSGYVEIGEIHFDPKGESIYQDEISEIVELLQNGVIF